MQRGIVSLQNSHSTVAIRIEDVTVESKAMRDSLAVRNFSSETVDGEILVLIVLLKDLNNAGDGVCVVICVGSWIQIMERPWIFRLAVRKGKVDGDVHVNFTSSKDVIQE